MEDPRPGVRTFAREVKRLFLIAIKGRAPLDQLFDGARTILDERPDGFGVAEAIAGAQGVLFVELDFVVFGERGGDAALGVLGGRFAEFVLRQDKDTAAVGQFHGGAETGYSRADDQIIAV